MKHRIVFFLIFFSFLQVWGLKTNEIYYIQELLKTTKSINDNNITIEQKNNLLLYAKEKGNQQLYIKQLIDIGKLYDSLSIYDKAIEYYFKAINESDNYAGYKNIFGISQPWVLVYLGNALFKLSYYKEASDCFKQASIYFNNEGNIPAIITCYINIGMSYLNQLSPPKAMSYFEKARKLAQLFKRDDLIAKSDIYIGMCYEGIGDRDNALTSINKAINYYSLVNDNYNILISNYDLASIYYEAELYDSAAFFYDKVQILAENNINLDIVLSSVLFKAKCYSQISGTIKAINTLKTIESNIKQTKNSDLLIDYYNTVFDFYNKIGDYKSALKYHVDLSNLKESINESQKSKDIAVYQFRIKSDMLDSKIEFLEETNKLILLEKNIQRNLAYFLIFSSIVLISISLGSKKKLRKKIELINDYFESMESKDKLLLLVLSIIYFFLFFIIFKPTGITHINSQNVFFSFKNILPGLLSIIIIPISYLLVFRNKINWFKKNTNIVTKMILFAMLFFLFVTSGIYFNITHFQFIVLSSQEILLILMVVLASIILPFFLSLTIIDNYILKRMAIKAIQLTNEIKSINVNNEYIPDNDVTFSTTKTKERFTVNISKLIAIQAQGNYCKFYFIEEQNIKSTMLLITIKSTEELLMFDPRFIRCHKSHIVNINYIDFISGNSRGYQIAVKKLDFKIPASRGYQGTLKTRIEELKKEK